MSIYLYTRLFAKGNRGLQRYTICTIRIWNPRCWIRSTLYTQQAIYCQEWMPILPLENSGDSWRVTFNSWIKYIH